MTASDLPGTTKLVLFVIAEYANSIDDTCWPSIDEIAGRATLTARAVSKHLGVAERAGWIRRWKSRKSGRKWAHGHYRLTVPEDVAMRARDDLSLDIAGARAGHQEPRSGDCGEFEEPGSGNAGELAERGSADTRKKGGAEVESGSCRNHVPTNNPMNRNYETLSLSQTPVVYPGGEGTGREGNRQEGFAALAAWMARRLRDNDPGASEPDLAEWASDVDGMLADGFEPQQIVKLWTWALEDGFWCSVIRSPARLRKNWEQLRAKRNQSLTRERQPAQQQGKDDRCCAHVDDDGTRCTNVATSILGAGSARRGYCRLHVGIYEI
ncbi:helix-turn-helix domain-containing protein [Burkholderia sp. Bp9017]|uniref:helix-turn-helix domain-containing protein n=1 Tax=unclassified Burkholderia TaxID=2613784 RepID=UPI000F6035FE|nr:MULTISPECIES: helix-turn-helix domain-containing protein [unclassified Burkholderia]RQZ27321.1 helix-turn-helix domain-containing protein [Burkholderia sp. Bp9017]RQZ34600.1 helix-turn-helix domain-containing protein [Burkholderia sp. Bp9016]